MSYTLQDVPTRFLLTALRTHIPWYSSLEEDTDRELHFVHSRPAPGGQGFDAVYATRLQLKCELATRPHVPSKREGQAIRRLQAQTGWSVEDLRAHPRYGMEITDAQFPNRRVVTAEFAARMSKYYGDQFGRLFKVVS